VSGRFQKYWKVQTTIVWFLISKGTFGPSCNFFVFDLSSNLVLKPFLWIFKNFGFGHFQKEFLDLV
jgi:hypothetical protein